MKIFDIEGDSIILNAQILGIPPFRCLWQRDRSKDKEDVYNEISYITFLCDNSLDNPFRGYSEIEKEKILKEKFFTIDWKPDKLVLEAIEQFKNFQQTISSRLVMSARNAADKLADWFNNVDFDEIYKSGKPKYTADSLLANLEKLNRVIKSLKSLERELITEQAESDTARGNTEIGEYENP